MYFVLSCLSTDKPVKNLSDIYEILLSAYNTGASEHWCSMSLPLLQTKRRGTTPL